MILEVCHKCEYGAEKEGKSHCQRESVYSYLTNCIRQKAIDYYLTKNNMTVIDKAI